MNVRELIEYLAQQNPDALVVTEIPCSNEEFVEVGTEGNVVMCGVNEGRHMTRARTYQGGKGRIPCVVLTDDNNPR